jgi:hypothetical protein
MIRFHAARAAFPSTLQRIRRRQRDNDRNGPGGAISDAPESARHFVTR